MNKKRTGKIIFRSKVIVPFKKRNAVNHYTIYGCKEINDQYKFGKYLNYNRILENKPIYCSYNEKYDFELHKRYIPKNLDELKDLLNLSFSWSIIGTKYEYACSGTKIFYIDSKGYFRESELDYFAYNWKHQTWYDVIDFENEEMPRCYGYQKKEKPIFVAYFTRRKINESNWNNYDRFYIAVKLSITNNYQWDTSNGL